MTIRFSPVLPDYTERRFTDILALEENGQFKFNVYVDTKGLATIGAGFLVSAWAGTILKNMTQLGLNTPANAAILGNAAKAIGAATKDIKFASDGAAQTAILPLWLWEVLFPVFSQSPGVCILSKPRRFFMAAMMPTARRIFLFSLLVSPA